MEIHSANTHFFADIINIEFPQRIIKNLFSQTAQRMKMNRELNLIFS